MRLGGPITTAYNTPAEWVAAMQANGYRAAICPVDYHASSTEIQAYAKAAAEADIIIAEVGAWSNPISPDEATRSAAIDKCQRSLALADEIGAVGCVNITGSRGEIWDGPHPANLTDETFDMIVETTRKIIDAVNPKRAYYGLESMPYMYPDSAESYGKLLKAIDRPQLGVHFDPVNITSSPQIYYNNGAMIRDFIQKLGSQIKSVHLKDIVLESELTVHLNEARPGQGHLDYPTLLTELDTLGPDLPIMLEHLPAEEYPAAAEYVRSVAQQVGVRV